MVYLLKSQQMLLIPGQHGRLKLLHRPVVPRRIAIVQDFSPPPPSSPYSLLLRRMCRYRLSRHHLLRPHYHCLAGSAHLLPTRHSAEPILCLSLRLLQRTHRRSMLLSYRRAPAVLERMMTAGAAIHQAAAPSVAQTRTKDESSLPLAQLHPYKATLFLLSPESLVQNSLFRQNPDQLSRSILLQTRPKPIPGLATSPQRKRLERMRIRGGSSYQHLLLARKLILRIPRLHLASVLRSQKCSL